MNYCVIMSPGRCGSTFMLSKLDGMVNTYVHVEEFNYVNVFADLYKFNYITPKSRHNVNKKRKIDKNIYLNGIKLKKILNLHLSNYNLALKKKIGNTKNHKYKILRLDDFFKDDLSLSLSEYPNYFFDKLISLNKLENINQIIFKNIETNSIVFIKESFKNIKFIHLLRSPFDYYNSIMGYNNQNSINTSFFRLAGDSLIFPIYNRWRLHAEYLENYKDSPNSLLFRFNDLFNNKEELKQRIKNFFNLDELDFFDQFTIYNQPLNSNLNTGLWIDKDSSSNQNDLRGNNHKYKKIYTVEYNLIAKLLESQLINLNIKHNKLPSKLKIYIQWLIPLKSEIVGTFNYYFIDTNYYNTLGILRRKYMNPIKIALVCTLILFFIIHRRLLILKLFLKKN